MGTPNQNFVFSSEGLNHLFRASLDVSRSSKKKNIFSNSLKRPGIHDIIMAEEEEEDNSIRSAKKIMLDESQDQSYSYVSGDITPIRPLSPATKTREVKRYQVSMEITETEKKYCSNLWVILDHFSRSLSRHQVLPQNLISQIFPSCIEEIYKYHCDLLLDLDLQMINWTSRSSLVATIEKFFMFPQSCLLKQYESYLHQFPHMITSLREFCSQDNSLARFIKDLESSVICERLELNAFLLSPIQRVPRYVLLFRQLQRYTNSESKDYTKLEITLNSLSGFLTRLNDSMETSLSIGNNPISSSSSISTSKLKRRLAFSNKRQTSKNSMDENIIISNNNINKKEIIHTNHNGDNNSLSFSTNCLFPQKSVFSLENNNNDNKNKDNWYYYYNNKTNNENNNRNSLIFRSLTNIKHNDKKRKNKRTTSTVIGNEQNNKNNLTNNNIKHNNNINKKSFIVKINSSATDPGANDISITVENKKNNVLNVVNSDNKNQLKDSKTSHSHLFEKKTLPSSFINFSTFSSTSSFSTSPSLPLTSSFFSSSSYSTTFSSSILNAEPRKLEFNFLSNKNNNSNLCINNLNDNSKHHQNNNSKQENIFAIATLRKKLKSLTKEPSTEIKNNKINNFHTIINNKISQPNQKSQTIGRKFGPIRAFQHFDFSYFYNENNEKENINKNEVIDNNSKNNKLSSDDNIFNFHDSSLLKSFIFDNYNINNNTNNVNNNNGKYKYFDNIQNKTFIFETVKVNQHSRHSSPLSSSFYYGNQNDSLVSKEEESSSKRIAFGNRDSTKRRSFKETIYNIFKK